MGRLRALVVGSKSGLLGLVFGCGGVSTQDPTASEPIARDAFAPRLATVICENLAPCCRADGSPYDEPTCRAELEREFAAAVALFSSSKIAYDAIAAGRCLESYVRTISACQEPDSAATEAPCLAVFVGTLPEGAACAGSNECARPPGRRVSCSTAPSGGIGEGTNTPTPPPTTTRCVLESNSPRGKAFESCIGNCLTSDEDPSCYARFDTGACGTALCYREDGLHCASGSGCSVCVPIAKLGERCTTGGCEEGLVCDGGHCAAKRDFGPCSMSFLDICASRSYCDFEWAGQCILKDVDGAPCSTGYTCESGYCEISESGGGIEAPPPSSGAGGAGTGGSNPAVHTGVCAKPTIPSQATCRGDW